MKKRLLFILLTFMLVVKAQSKQETINWLNDKLSTSPYIISGNSSYAKHLKINNDGNFTVTQPNEFFYIPSLNHEVIFSGNFKKLSPNSVKINVHNGNYYLYASCSSGNCITQVSKYPDSTETFTTNDVILGITYEYELAERCKKAIIHLIKLSGGKNEAF